MLSINNISKKYGNFAALKTINVQFSSGDSIALLGPNGSGKTTFIKAILGLVNPSSGFINFNNEAISQNELKKLTGYMPQIGQYPENMKVDALFKMMISLRKSHLKQCDTELYELFDMDRIAQKYLGNLSGGTKQKVGAVLAFLFKPKILILDEPTAGLDPYSSTVLKDKIKSFQDQENIIIITSHVVSELNDIVSKVMYLIEGNLHFYKDTESLKIETEQSILEKALAQILTTKSIYSTNYANS